MNAQNNNHENIIVGLKSEVSRQVGFKNWEADCKDYSTSCLIKSWKTCPADKVGDLAWDFVENAPFSLWKKCKSDLLGIYSKIGVYENKKGVKSPAHFTQNDKYLGSVKALGDKPIGYEGNFQIKRDKFVYDPTALTTCNNVAQLFVPKPLPVEDPEDNIPIAQLIAKKRAEKAQEAKENELMGAEDINHAVAPAPVVPEPKPKRKYVRKEKPKKNAILILEPTFTPSPSKGKVGLSADGKYIHFPMFLMGCCGDDSAVVKIVKIPVPELINKAFLESVAKIIKETPFLDWDWYSFQQNILVPNREHIQLIMGLDDFFTDRVISDGMVVLNNWDKDYDEDEIQEAKDEGIVLVSHHTFFTEKDCEF